MKIVLAARSPYIDRRNRTVNSAVIFGEREELLGSPIMYIELVGSYAPRLAAFYIELFDWKFFNPGATDYSMFQSGEGGIGGAIYPDAADRQMGRNWIPYVQVDDIQKVCSRAVELGGAIVYPKREIPETGWSAHLTDPDGNLIGLFTPLKKA